MDREPLTDEYLEQCSRDARRHQGSWTGTAGNLAAHVMRLLAEVNRLKVAEAYRRERRVPMPSLQPHDEL